MRRLSTFAIVLAMLDGGCAVVANLGEPKDLIDGGPADTGVEADSQGPSDGGDSSGPPPQAVAIAVGSTHACAVVGGGPSSPENGTLRCWGSNGNGELGSDPTKVTMSSRPLEVDARGTTIPPPVQRMASALTLAFGYSCTITTDNYLLCWGNVPSGSSVMREQDTQPYQPSLMDFNVTRLTVASASMGPAGGCSTLFDQSVVCWGGDLAPQSPDGGALLDGGVFVGDGFESVAVGTAHACGIGAPSSSSTRDVECWGANDRGQAGAPFSSLENHPHHLGLGQMGNLVQAASGGDVSCALFQSGALYCWGAGDRGQLGPGAAGADSYVPVAIPLPRGAIAVTVGDAHVCALLSDRSVWCWGDNTAAQLGGGPGGPSLSATRSQVLKGPGHYLSGVQTLAAGGHTTCALLFGDPNVWCWGANDDGQAGQTSGSPVAYASRVAW